MLAILLLSGCSSAAGPGSGSGGGGGNLQIPTAVYYVNLGTATNSIAAYSTAPVAGGGSPSALTGSPFSTTGSSSVGSPFGLAFRPGRGVLYAVNDAGTVSSFTVNADGTLTTLGAAANTGGTGASGVAVNSTGTFAAVANSANNSIQMFTVTGSGLAALGSPVMTGGLQTPASLAFSPDGSHLFAGNTGGSGVGISAFSVSGIGVLTAVSGSPFSTGGNLTEGLAISPDGSTLYAAVQDTAKIAALAIAGTGSLSALGTVSTCVAPIGLALNAGGSHLYVACAASNAVDVFSVSGAAVSHLAGPYATQSQKTAMVSLDGSGQLLVALDEISSGVTLFAVHADGTLNGAPAALYSNGTTSAQAAVLAR